MSLWHDHSCVKCLGLSCHPLSLWVYAAPTFSSFSPYGSSALRSSSRFFSSVKSSWIWKAQRCSVHFSHLFKKKKGACGISVHIFTEQRFFQKRKGHGQVKGRKAQIVNLLITTLGKLQKSKQGLVVQNKLFHPCPFFLSALSFASMSFRI